MYKFLKRGRVVLSLILFVTITASFIYLTNKSAHGLFYILKFQFVPSLLGIFTGGAIFFIFLMVLTLLFGRVYCSTLCPLGIYQDIVIRVANRFKSKKKRLLRYDKPYNWIRYGFLLVVGLLFAAGTTYPLALLDPYSNWGRISNELIGKLEQLIHNGLSDIFPETVYYRAFAYFSMGAFAFALLILLLVTVLSAFRGRLYCNTICPVGAFLGLTSKFAIFKPTINREACNSCKLCSMKCKSQCIDIDTHTIDETRCVACLNCMAACNRGAISYRFVWKKQPSENESIVKYNREGRRRAILTMGVMGTAITARAFNWVTPVGSVTKIKGVVPPGAISLENLKLKCTGCQACISACPNGIIRPAAMEYGIDGMFLPVIGFDHHFCAFDCNICTTVCPNGAIRPLKLEEKKQVQLGVAKFHIDRCIPNTNGTDCGACDEHCPTKAVSMVPYGDGLRIPEVNPEICLGCGGCEYVCPVQPQKAIIVEPWAVHAVAKPPVIEEQEKVEIDDFGF